MQRPHETAPEGPLAGVRVMVTGARGDDRLRDLLQRLGATVLALPAIAILPPEDLAPLNRALDHLAGYDWIAFSSRNAVRALLDRASTPIPHLPSPTGGRGGEVPWTGTEPARAMCPGQGTEEGGEGRPGSEGTPRIAAVGPSTAAELEDRGFPVHCVPNNASGAALAQAMAALGLAGARVLLPVGDLSRPDLKNGLLRAGARVDEVLVYRTVRPDGAGSEALDALRYGAVDAVTLLSPSAIRNLVEMLGPDGGCLQSARLVCIGPTTAAAVRELAMEPAAVAAEQTLESLAQALVACCATERFHERL